MSLSKCQSRKRWIRRCNVSVVNFTFKIPFPEPSYYLDPHPYPLHLVGKDPWDS